MQLSQSFSFPKSISNRKITAVLVVAGISGSIILHRLEPLLIPLGIFPVMAGKSYINIKKEKEELRSQVSSLGYDLAYSQEIQQEQKFTLLELQEENTKLKNVSLQNKELSQQKVEYLESLLKSLSSERQQQKQALLKLQEEKTKLQDASLQDAEKIQQLQQKIDSQESSIKLLQETIEYYEKEIIDENQVLRDRNKFFEQTVEELKVKQELLQDECDASKQEKVRLLAEIKAISQFDSQTHQTELNSILDLVRDEEIELDSIDLSDRKLAIVGGHTRVQNALVEALNREYNLREVIKFTSNDRGRRITQQHIKDVLKSCDYIVMITGNLSSYIQRTIRNLNSNGHLQGDILTITESRGESGVLREINNFLIAQ